MKKETKIEVWIAITATLLCAGTIILCRILGFPPVGRIRYLVLGFILLTGGLPIFIVGASMEEWWFKKHGESGGPLDLLFKPFAFLRSILPLILEGVGCIATLGGLGLVIYAVYCLVSGRP